MATNIAFALTYVALFASIFFLLSFFEKPKIATKRPLTNFPKVTVAIPVHNGAENLASTIKSVLNLDYPKDKLQVIVVENGKSTDNSLKIAKSFEKRGVTVVSLEKGGKGNAMNHAISIANGEFFACLDDDSFVSSIALKEMLPLFADESVMAVTPALKVHKPKTILQHVQNAEYMLGVFLRESFSAINSIHVTPGPFTVYRKSFFDKHGGFDEQNLTEDMEVALRIQRSGYRIEHAINAAVHTVSPKSFLQLRRQRLRWYLGFIENMSNYRDLFDIKKHGVLAAFVLPMAFVSVIFSLYVLFHAGYIISVSANTFATVLQQTGFGILAHPNMEGLKEILTPRPLFIISSIILGVGLTGLYSATKRASDSFGRLMKSYVLFFFLYGFLFSFWWFDTFIHKSFGRELRFGPDVVWKNSIINNLLKKISHKVY